MEHLIAAQQSTTLVPDELNHRVHNNLAMITSVLELQARSQKEQAVKDAFVSTVGRVNSAQAARQGTFAHFDSR